MSEWVQIIGLFLLSSTKFLFAPSSVVAAGFSFFETLLITTLGGWFGVLIFYYFGRILIDLILRGFIKIKNGPPKEKKTFTFTNKLIVRTKAKYGLIGLALITPVIISIPVGSIIAARYFSRTRGTIYYLFMSVLFWSLVLTSASTHVVNLFE